MESEDSRHSIAAQQAAANNYQYSHNVPLVGDKLPSDCIPQEYAKADPIYVEKTLGLAQTYSYFRPIRGDGNSIGFSYFETLACYGTPDQIENEVARLKGWDSTFESPGGFDCLDDFQEPFGQLLQSLQSKVIDRHEAQAEVYRVWNSLDDTNAIIYYLRILARLYLKDNAAKYEPFVQEHDGIEGYCQSTIDRVDHEIDHLGIIALAGILLKPIDVVLEIAYLDRSPGPTVNKYRFPEEANRAEIEHSGVMIHLLFRPNHYDILYRNQPGVTAIDPQQDIYHVHRVADLSQNVMITATPSVSNFTDAELSAMALIPGFNSISGGFYDNSLVPIISGAQMQSEVSSTHWMTEYNQPMQQSYVLRAPPPAVSTDSTDSPNRPISESPNLTITTSTSTSPDANTTAPVTVTTPAAGSAGDGYLFRFTAVQRDYDEIPGQFQVQTTAFKNSVWNTAHFGNPNFHPEEWEPSDEFLDGRSSRRRRHREVDPHRQ